MSKKWTKDGYKEMGTCEFCGGEHDLCKGIVQNIEALHEEIAALKKKLEEARIFVRWCAEDELIAIWMRDKAMAFLASLDVGEAGEG